MRHAILPAAIFAISLFPCLATAQAPESPAVVKEQIDVRVTSIDFVATDTKGKVLSGLDPKSLTVTENGTPRTVTGFSEVRRDKPTPAAPQQRIAIFIDDSTLTTTTRKKVMGATGEFARSAAQRGDLVEIVTFNTVMAVRQPWTDDTAEIDKIFAVITRELPGGMARESERRRVKSQIEALVGDANSGSNAPAMSFDQIIGGVKNYVKQRADEVDRSAAALAAYITPLASIPGRKTMILASESLPTRPGSDMTQFVSSVQQQLATGGGPLATGAARSSQQFEEGRYQKGELLAAVASLALSSEVTIYGINPSGPAGSNFGSNVEATGPSASPSADFASGVGGMDGLQLLSTATGGVAQFGTQPKKALEQIDAELGTYYSVSYQSDLAPGQPRKLEIRSSNPAVKLRYAHNSIVSLAPAAVVPVGDTDIALAPPANELNIAVQRGREIPLSLEQRQIMLLIVIPVDNLAFEQVEGGDFTGGFDLAIQFRSRDGKEVSSVNRQSQPIRWTAAQKASAKGVNINFTSDVIITGERHQVAVELTDKVSGKKGYATIDLSSPAN